MGTEVGRIEKEFVFKSLVDDGVPCDLHATRREFPCRFSGVSEDRLEMSPLEGKLEGLNPGDEVRVFFYLKNNYHTFASRVLEADQDHVVVQQPPGVYKNLQRKYGISTKERNRMLRAQGYRCAGCRKKKQGHWNVDHCHRTERVRGVLCRPCNLALGFARDVPSTLRRLADYLEKERG